jgi:hypothetical protein
MFKNPKTSSRLVLNNPDFVDIWKNLKDNAPTDEDYQEILAFLIAKGIILNEEEFAGWVEDMDNLYGDSWCMPERSREKSREASILELFLIMFVSVYGLLFLIGLVFWS